MPLPPIASHLVCLSRLLCLQLLAHPNQLATQLVSHTASVFSQRTGNLRAMKGAQGRVLATCMLCKFKGAQVIAMVGRPVLLWWAAYAPGLQPPITTSKSHQGTLPLTLHTQRKVRVAGHSQCLS